MDEAQRKDEKNLYFYTLKKVFKSHF